MEEQKNIISYAVDKNYVDFSAAVKQEMLNKLANSSEMRNFTSEFDKIQQMKNLFSQISNSNSSN